MRPRIVFAIIAAVVTFAAVVPAATAAAPAPATSSSKQLALVAQTTVTTSNKMKWTLTLTWVQGSAGFPGLLTIGIEHPISGSTGQFEDHQWSIPVTSSTMSFSTSSGRGTLNGGNQTSPLADVDVHFVAGSHAKATCSSGSETRYAGKLSGRLTLKTGLTHGGTVGGHSVHFTVGRPEVTLDSNCVAPTKYCAVGADFDAIGQSGTPGVVGFNSGSTHTDDIAVVRTVSLTSPAGATRADEGGLSKAPNPSYSSSSKILTVTEPRTGILTGTAHLGGGSRHTEKSTCKVGKTKYDISELVVDSATYSSPSGKALTAHTALTGKLVVGSSINHGDFDISTRTHA